jgi:hypothetical protein
MDGAMRDTEADAIHGDKARKVFCEVMSFEDEIVAHDAMPPLNPMQKKDDVELFDDIALPQKNSLGSVPLAPLG